MRLSIGGEALLFGCWIVLVVTVFSVVVVMRMPVSLVGILLHVLLKSAYGIASIIMWVLLRKTRKETLLQQAAMVATAIVIGGTAFTFIWGNLVALLLMVPRPPELNHDLTLKTFMSSAQVFGYHAMNATPPVFLGTLSFCWAVRKAGVSR